MDHQQAANALRQGFKYLNKFMVMLFRLGLGNFGNQTAVGGYIMVITHTGRKTGQRRRTPVNFAIIDGDVYCTAGFGRIAHWYRNIMANPGVELWLPDSWWTGEAEDVTGCEGHVDLMRQVLINSGFAAYLAGINPHTLSDQALADLTADYRLIRIRRIAPRTGPDGPGELAWVWPASTFLLLGWLLRPRRRRHSVG